MDIMIANTEALTLIEQDELDVLEEVIETGLQTFVDVGTALMAIRDKRLYRADYGTFEDYCQDRWAMGRRRANQLIGAAQVVSNLGTNGSHLATERQARPLTDLDPEQQREVWQRAEATANGRVTGAHIETTKREYLSSLSSADGASGDIYDSPEDSFDDWQPEPSAANPNILHSSESNEWYTPKEYIDAVHEVMGGIDLDPASCEFANRTVQAECWYDKEEDGLLMQWYGRIYLNPPYGKTDGESNQAVWSKQLVDYYEQGEIDEAVLLVNATPGNKWFAPLWNYPICFVNHRISFISPDGERSGPTHSNCFVYLGLNRERFAEVFSRFGVVAVRYEP